MPPHMFHVKPDHTDNTPQPGAMTAISRTLFHVKRRRSLPFAVLVAVALLGSGCVGIQEAEGWAAPVEVNDRILLQSERGQLSLVDRNNGALSWRYPEEADGASPFYATPVVDGSTVYLATLRGRITRLQASLASPTEDWSLELDERVIATPLLRGGDLFVPTENGRIVVVTADTGRIARTIETTERRMWGAPAATASTMFIGDLENRATAALSLSNGEMIWERPISGATAADLALDGDLLLVGSFDQSLHALNVATGDERWAFAGRGWFVGRPLVEGGVVFAATMGGHVYAIDRDTGVEVWSQAVDGAEFRATPVITNGHLVAVARNGRVHAFSLANGTPAWSQRVNDDGNVNADVLVDGTDLYLVTSKQRLIRVDLARDGAFQVVPLVANR
ncbi:MAG: hypothetical protein DWG80_06090 [Chloroflexi bacterium]|nr:hypothetical protein [Chloroflexota bacterium]